MIKFKKSFLLLLMTLLFSSTSVYSITNLKNVQITGGNEVDLLFDKPVDPKQVKVDFFRDIIQLSIKGVSVYPAKIYSVKGKNLKKVFAYQYTPNLIRTRLTIEGDAKKYKESFGLTYRNRVITLKVPKQLSIKEKITTHSAQAKRAESKPKRSREFKKSQNKKERKKKEELVKKIVSAEDGKLTKGREVVNPFSSLIWLTVLMALFGVAVFFFKRLKERRNISLVFKKAGLEGLTKVFQNNPFKSKSKLIELVASHYLGPKKSIAVVRVGARMLVLGVTDESINLITQIENEEDLNLFQEAGEQNSDTQPELEKKEKGPSLFSSILESEGRKPGATKPEKLNSVSSRREGETKSFSEVKGGIRDQIRKKTEGLKDL